MRKIWSDLEIPNEILVLGIVLLIFIVAQYYQQQYYAHREVRDLVAEAEDSYQERLFTHKQAVNQSDSMFRLYEFEGIVIGQEPVRRSAHSTWFSMVRLIFSPIQIQPAPAGRPVDKYFDFSQPQTCQLFIRYEKPVTRADTAANDPNWLGKKIRKREGEVFVTIGRDTLLLGGRSNLPKYKNEFPVRTGLSTSKSDKK